jgi:hypothetical protein
MCGRVLKKEREETDKSLEKRVGVEWETKILYLPNASPLSPLHMQKSRLKNSYSAGLQVTILIFS